MRAYIIRRLLLIIPTLFLLSILVFLSVRFIPGDVIDVMVAEMDGWHAAGADIDRESLERMLGLDVPVYVQYGRWIGVLPTPDWITKESHFNGILQGTLGQSLIGGQRPIEEQIIQRLPVTIQLGVMAIVIGLVIALPVGIYSAIRQDTAADYVGRTAAVIGLATPNFWLAIMVTLYPAIWWGWSPSVEYIRLVEDPLGNLGMFIIPSVILGTAMSAATMRLTRTMMLEVLRQDYVRTAWSKGLKERVVVMRHAIKNALIPVVTLIGLQLPLLVGGSVIMENIFNLPGLGRMFLDSLEARDYPVIQGVNLFFATVVMFSILLIDVIYPYLDPRVRYS
ncbi:MAG: ABC transporter permease [Spirochaetaceae bacterium]|nr:ABC transporter permease [Spirochaetaceae bacterium]